MKSSWVAILNVIVFVSMLPAGQNLDRARQLEASGDVMGARGLLARAAQASTDISALAEYAEFLDLHGDAAAKEAYTKLLAALDGPAHRAERVAVARRLAELSLLAGDRSAADSYLGILREAGADFTAPVPPANAGEGNREYIGAKRGDQRLPGLAQQRGSGGDRVSEAGASLSCRRRASSTSWPAPTRSSDRDLRITQTNDLLRILGYRMRGGCGSEVVLETVNAARAFLTTDSGFPLAELEQALRTDKPFPTITIPPAPGALRRRLLAVARRKRPRAISSTPSSAIRAVPAFISACRSWIRKPRTIWKASPVRGCGLRARAGFLRRQLRDPAGQSDRAGRRKIGGAWADWPELRRTKAPSSSRS
jgi:hypothetical protein